MNLGIGLLGCGTIGTEIVGAVADGRIGADLRRVHDRNPEKVRAALDPLDDPSGVTAASDPREVAEEVDLVVEAAGQGAVADVAVDVLETGTDLMLMSVGALADDSLRAAVLEAAEAHDATLYAPSGAIAGLDAVKAAVQAGDVESVTLSTRKPPAGLEGAPYVEREGIDLDGMTEAETVFEGSAAEAAEAFPSNINVGMALSLAGIGPARTRVRIVADPEESNNVHRVRAEGSAGTIETTVRNVPSPTNPKTSYLASLSAIAKLRGLTTRTSVGT